MEDCLRKLDEAVDRMVAAAAGVKAKVLELAAERYTTTRLLDMLGQIQAVLTKIEGQPAKHSITFETKSVEEAAQVIERLVTSEPLQETFGAVATTAQEAESDDVPRKRKSPEYHMPERKCVDCPTVFKPRGGRNIYCPACAEKRRVKRQKAGLQRMKDKLAEKAPVAASVPSSVVEPGRAMVHVPETTRGKKYANAEAYNPRPCPRVRNGKKCGIVFVPATHSQLYCGPCTREVAEERVPALPHIPGQVSSAIQA